MKSPRSLILSLALALVAGCAAPTGAKFPAPTADFSPRREYEAGIEKVWKATNDALDENRIAIASADKPAGRIQTDTVAGATTMYMGGILGVGNSRYSFSIRITPEGAKTKLVIFAKLEQSFHGKNGATPYNDLTAQNPAVVKNLENWLYQEIEKRL